MWIKSSEQRIQDVLTKEITPREHFEGRRSLLKQLSSAGMIMGATGSVLNARAQSNTTVPSGTATTTGGGKLAPLPGSHSNASGAYVMEKVTSYADASSYNNYYEFGTDKGDPVKNAHTLKTSPWSIQVEGLIKKPMKITLEDCLLYTSPSPRD